MELPLPAWIGLYTELKGATCLSALRFAEIKGDFTTAAGATVGLGSATFAGVYNRTHVINTRIPLAKPDAH